ncbi:hypothetical protein EHM69_03555 [candidate division KSB1 bacterium]|nr:MAG: hypothetical protein EHM69_03555 [candidate division KSB1 bacterium]
MIELSVDLAGLKLKNPLLPGSGPPGDNLRKLQKLDAAGIGALLTKTVSSELPFIPKPCMAFDGELFFNVEKWSDKSYQEWLSDILPALRTRTAPLIASLGYTPEDLEKLIPLFDPFVDGFEISTHYVSGSASLMLRTVRQAKQLTKRPVFMKLSAHLGDITASAIVCEKGGADGITAINSIGPVMSIDVDKKSSRLGEDNPYMWLSGPAVKPIAMRAVFDISRAVDIPVIACGGVTGGRDVIEFMLAGATAVECCTALTRKGPELVPQILEEVHAWCAAHRVSKLRDIIGTVTPHYQPSQEKP